MKKSALHTKSWIVLIALAIAVVVSSIGSSFARQVAIERVVTEENTKSTEKNSKVVSGDGIVAVVVSIVNLNFEKEINFYPIQFIDSVRERFSQKNYSVAIQNFLTILFTHIIAPNAP